MSYRAAQKQIRAFRRQAIALNVAIYIGLFTLLYLAVVITFSNHQISEYFSAQKEISARLDTMGDQLNRLEAAPHEPHMHPREILYQRIILCR